MRCILAFCALTALLSCQVVAVSVAPTVDVTFSLVVKNSASTIIAPGANVNQNPITQSTDPSWNVFSFGTGYALSTLSLEFTLAGTVVVEAGSVSNTGTNPITLTLGDTGSTNFFKFHVSIAIIPPTHAQPHGGAHASSYAALTLCPQILGTDGTTTSASFTLEFDIPYTGADWSVRAEAATVGLRGVCDHCPLRNAQIERTGFSLL
jgi:hypothetical protein